MRHRMEKKRGFSFWGESWKLDDDIIQNIKTKQNYVLAIYEYGGAYFSSTWEPAYAQFEELPKIFKTK